jgi:tetratricopeptide (TPR) repeat protein
MCPGELSALKPGAEVKRFKAGNMRVLGAHGVAAAVQEVEGLKRLAGVLRCSGLVQVDEGKRTFCMHQLLQQAVGRELGWQEQCERMRQLLHTRCGQFGDEKYFDVGLYGVMREVASTAFSAVERLRAEEGVGVDTTWCSGMLLRLYEVAREVYGAETEFPRRVISAAFNSIVANMMCADVIEMAADNPANMSKKLHELVDDVLNSKDSHLNNLFLLHPDNIRASAEEDSKSASPVVADGMMIGRYSSYVRKCLSLHWASLCVRLVRLHVIHKGISSPEGVKAMPINNVAAVPLIQDVVSLCNVLDLEHLLKGAQGMRVIGEDAVSCVVVASVLEEDREVAERYRLKVMRWRFYTLKDNLELQEQLIEEIQTAHKTKKGESELWAIGVALGCALHSVAASGRDMFDYATTVSAYRYALEMLERTLGEQHPVTACTRSSMGTTLIDAGDRDEAIKCFERALSVDIDILGQHPSTAGTMLGMGAAYGQKGAYDDAIRMFEQALGIYERTVGRMHRDAAFAINNMCRCYYEMNNLDMAQQLALEALDIYTETLGPNHKETVEARKDWEFMRKKGGEALCRH